MDLITYQEMGVNFLGQFAVQALVKTVNAPLERTKILLQVQHTHIMISPQQRYKGPLDCIWRQYS